jgi:hypothetical protein
MTESMRVKDMPCVAPDCERMALLRSEGRPVCNRHYLLWRTRGTFENVPKRQTKFNCAECGAQVERLYTMTEARKGSPQYCTKECFSKALKKRSAKRLGKRFWSKVAIADKEECWLWQGMLKPSGYGYFNSRRGETTLAHRHAYMLETGKKIDSSVHICHSCDNPRCVNPAHLWEGDPRSNYDDMVSKGRRVYAPLRGQASPHSRLTEAQAREVLQSPLGNKQLADKFGVSSSAIWLIRNGKNWRHLQEAS